MLSGLSGLSGHWVILMVGGQTGEPLLYVIYLNLARCLGKCSPVPGDGMGRCHLGELVVESALALVLSPLQ